MGASVGSRYVLMASTGLKTALPARPRYFPRSMRSSPCTLQANFFPWLDHFFINLNGKSLISFIGLNMMKVMFLPFWCWMSYPFFNRFWRCLWLWRWFGGNKSRSLPVQPIRVHRGFFTCFAPWSHSQEICPDIGQCGPFLESWWLKAGTYGETN